MDTLGFVVVALGVLAFGLVSQKAHRFWTPPMAFVAFGLLIGQAGAGIVPLAG